ncbi:MAG: RagB/SusD family nutrient uptake outer membrane protein, partial [Bacteroidia bacterium]|nr:RagB/SusD family nutrient uptake outer membrane protein [Bacteroidia bacterium]
VFMRYAEVLLMYAECCAMTNDSANGLKYLNMIQERAGSKHISSTLTLDEVKKEKMFELWAEGCRWADMVRWGDFDGVLNAGKNIPSLYDSKWTKESSETRFYVKYSNPNTQETGFKKGKHELFPYPDYEIMTNPNISQNPGW